MKIPPKKPHFFKPIQPGFKNGLKIPIGFLKYLKGQDQIEHVVLRSGGKNWLVKVKCWRFGAGWAAFVEQHDLQLGDILVFRHEGNMEFEVSIFDSTHCDREYAEYLQEEDACNNVEETSKKFKFNGRPRPRVKLSKKASSHVKAVVHHKSFGHSHFDHIIREYNINSRCFLFLPQCFAYANGLTNKKCGLIIKDERQRSWNLKLSSYEARTYIRAGWPKFVVDNCLKKGDRIRFEVVTNEETPIWKFQVSNQETPLQKFQDIMKKPSNISLLDVGHSCFVSTLKPYCFTKAFLFLPMRFAKSNGLMNRNCEMILKGEVQRCWSVWLGRSGNHFGIIHGWTKFRAENGLQVGDVYKFELIKNGEIPIAHFHCKYSVKVAKTEEHRSK
ncbi:B3 domain-containing protein REM7 isoform X2 [Capsicum galapagoense]